MRKQQKKNRPRGRRVQTEVLVRAPTVAIRQTVAPSTITHREALTAVSMNVSPLEWKANFLLNPRRAATFPWLTAPAMGYEMYRFDVLSIEYVPDCPTTQAGNLAMFIDYDPTDDNSALNFTQVMAMAGAVTSQVYKPVSFNFRPDQTVLAAHRYYCADGSGVPDRLSDCGRLWVVTSGTTASLLQVGKLYTRYKVTFYNPETPPTLVGQNNLSKSKPGINGAGLGVTNEAILGTTTLASTTSNTCVKSCANLASSLQMVQNITDTANRLYTMIPKSELHTAVTFPDSGLNPIGMLIAEQHSYETDWDAGAAVIPYSTVPDTRIYYCVFTSNSYIDLSLEGSWTWTPTHNGDGPDWYHYVMPGWVCVDSWYTLDHDAYVAGVRQDIHVSIRAHYSRHGSIYDLFFVNLFAGGDGVLGPSTATPDNPNQVEIGMKPHLFHATS